MEQRLFNDISFEAFLSEEKLMGCRCAGCGQLYVPPRSICTKCSGSDLEWIEMKGQGRLSAFTCIAIGPPFMRGEGYDRKRPYCTGVVQLDEGPRVVARIEDVDTSRPEAIKLNTPLTVKFLRRGEGLNARTFLAFTPT